MQRVPFIYEPTSKQVANVLLSSGAYLVRMGVSQDEFFDWKARKKFAPTYTDVLKLAGDPAAYEVITQGLAGAIRDYFPQADYVIGLAEAGIIWSSMAAQQLRMPQAFVRKAAKAHGLPGRVACTPQRGGRAVLIDDLVASGSSIKEAADVLLNEVEIETIGILSIVNWDFRVCWERFSNTNIEVMTLASYWTVLDAALELQLLSPEAVAELKAFYQNPWEHQWNMAALKPWTGDS
jgi:orotate phosphoribosyltransferase